MLRGPRVARATLQETRLYSSHPMNRLHVGSDKSGITQHLPSAFLLIHDGPLKPSISGSSSRMPVANMRVDHGISVDRATDNGDGSQMPDLDLR